MEYKEAVAFHKWALPAFIFLCLLLFLTACGDKASYTTPRGCTVDKVDDATHISCPDGTNIVVEDGKDGENGQDGEDAVNLTKVTAPKNSCTQVGEGLYVENINNGSVFDVYYNSQCSDSLGEYCDNVVPAEPTVGQVDQYNGSGTVCWAGDIMLSGVVQDNGDIEVYLLDFNQ